jgi:hypothetical protein
MKFCELMYRELMWIDVLWLYTSRHILWLDTLQCIASMDGVARCFRAGRGTPERPGMPWARWRDNATCTDRFYKICLQTQGKQKCGQVFQQANKRSANQLITRMSVEFSVTHQSVAIGLLLLRWSTLPYEAGFTRIVIDITISSSNFCFFPPYKD